MKIILGLFLCFVANLNISAQLQKPISQSETFRFSPEVEMLPPGYQGNSVADIAAAISRLKAANNDKSLTKNETETYAGFASRLDEYNKNSRVKDTGSDNYFVYVLNNQQAAYNAGKGRLNIKTAFARSEKSVSAKLADETRKDSYTGSNILGIYVKVDKVISNYYDIEFLNEKFPEPLLSVSLKIDAPAAKSLKENIRTLIVFKLIPPYYESQSAHKKPTLEVPFESLDYFTTYKAKLLEIWFFDQSTGKIILKKHI